jgi:hypothetical protein
MITTFNLMPEQFRRIGAGSFRSGSARCGRGFGRLTAAASRREYVDRGKAMRAGLRIGAVVLALTLGQPAVASPFDTCVLQHMQGVTSDVAAGSVKEACLRTSETPLPNTALQTLTTMRAVYGKLPPGERGAGLYMSFNNDSGYTITELVLEIQDKTTDARERYVVRLFPFPPSPPRPGVIDLGYGPDRTPAMMIAPGPREFYVRIKQSVRDPKKWADVYAWGIVSAKGFR